jgi:hypothetical protein
MLDMEITYADANLYQVRARNDGHR